MQSTTLSSSRWPWILLPGRMLLFLLFQALIAAGFAAAGTAGAGTAGTGTAGAWDRSAAWWPATVTATNAVCLYLLVRLYRAEGCRFWDIFRIDRRHIKGDLLALLGLIVITGPVAMLPNTMIATALYGDSLAPVRQFLAPLPPVGLFFALVLFPITQGLVELPIYFIYIMPRLAKQVNPWAAYGLAGLFLGIQHAMIPLRFDGRFFTWRLLMYIPFAFLIGGILKWRPRLLPYLAVIHVLIDFAAAAMYLTPF